MAWPVLNRPALKKYGLLRPDFSLNSPKRSTPSSRHRRMKSGWCMGVYFILCAHAHHHPQRQRHPFRGAQGLFRLARRPGRGRRLPAGDEVPARPDRRAPVSTRPATTATTSTRCKKGYSGVAMYSREKPLTVVARLRVDGVRRRGPLHRGALQEPERRFRSTCPRARRARSASRPSSGSSTSSCRTCAR